jgi:VanZ family protein
MLSLPHARIWLVLGWLLITLIFVGSLLPHVPTLGFGISDKVEHFGGYFLLMSWFSGLYERRQHWVLALVFFLMGCTIEVLQGVFTDTRDMDVRDALANGAGILAAYVLARLGLANWTRRVESLWTRSADSRENT